jgi:hypothetical protein
MLLIHGNQHNIFSFMDDLAKTGTHMTESSKYAGRYKVAC